MDYSKTVNLPDTAFPMKANLPNREPEIQKQWEERDIYNKLISRPAPRGLFVLHDGPPYSNGDIHIGHALNKLLKDFVVRYKSMRGYRTPYVPGWDNHGLPIENKVSGDFRKKGITPSILEMRLACRDYATKWVDVQKEQFKRLGGLGDWDKPYLTMSREYESAIIKVFGELAEQGYIYRGLKPIHWCIHDETALAEAEIEYNSHTSPSIYVRFPLLADPHKFFRDNGTPCFTVIWTTTPWTIPGNLAVAVHPDYTYAIVDADGARYLIAEELVAKTMEAIEAKSWQTVRTVRGIKLEDTVFKHPIFDRESPVVMAEYVTLEDGTGVVHTAPGHGREDFVTGQKYGLGALCPVDGRGYYTDDAEQFKGLHILRQGNSAVLETLKDNGTLLAQSNIEHSYPHCWRCRNPLVFRTTVQWFMSLDHNDLRAKILAALPNIEWFPAEAQTRLTAMMENSPDWCLSRQRSWGVAIPVFFCKKCSHPAMTRETINSVYEDSRKNGSDSWFEKDASDLLPPGFVCEKCGGAEFEKEDDVLDVWFDSGSSCRAVLEQREELEFPSDMYCEGSDQHRGWFNKSLVVGVATKGQSPFKELVSHGFVLDAEGKAMSKSLGNVIAPQKVIRDVGADVLRLFISSSDYSDDVRIGEESLKRVTDSYRRIRNTFRFILGNLCDFDPKEDAVAYEQMEEVDRFALHRLEELIDQVTWAYDRYEFHKVYRTVHNYCAVDLSSFYLDLLKDRLYASGAKWKVRRSAQTALYRILSSLARILAPIIPHTSEEVWQHMIGSNKAESVALTDFPEVDHQWMDADLAEQWATILDVRDSVMLALEEARQGGKIGKSLEARVRLHLPHEVDDTLESYSESLSSVFIVSQVELVRCDSGEITVEVLPPLGTRCDRCWLVLESVGNNEQHPTLCDRCSAAVQEMEPVAQS